MTLEQASALSQIVGAIGVVASLVFVGLQVRQNTRSQRVVAVNSLTAAAVAINVPGMQSPDFGEALSQAMNNWSAATRDQRIVAHYFLFSFFKLLAFYHCEGVKAGWWLHRGDVYSPEFQNYLSSTSGSVAKSAALESIFSGAAPSH